MAVSLDDLNTLRDALIRARASGVLTVRDSDGSEITYKTDGQMAAAIANLESRIAASSSPPIQTIRFHTTKGL